MKRGSLAEERPELVPQWSTSNTDDDGNVTFTGIAFGKYIVRETATVNGYQLTAPDIAFEVKDAVNVVVEPANTPYAEPVKVFKIDNETNDPLKGAEFAVFVDSNDNGVWDSADRKAQVWIDSNKNNIVDDGELKECVMSETSKGVYESNGKLHFNDGSKDFGKRYFIVEMKAPEGYFFVNPDGSFSEEKSYQAFSIEAKDTTVPDFKVGVKEFTFLNQTGTVFVNKINENAEFLSGAEFTVYKDEDCTVEIGKLIEDKEHEVYILSGLGIGTYYIKETVAPEYYTVDPNVYTFSITTEKVHVCVDNVKWDVIDGITGAFMNVNPIVKTTLTDTVTKAHIVAIRSILKWLIKVRQKLQKWL